MEVVRLWRMRNGDVEREGERGQCGGDCVRWNTKSGDRMGGPDAIQSERIEGMARRIGHAICGGDGISAE